MSKNFEQRIYDSLCYPGEEPRTLINKLGIRNLIELEQAETAFIKSRLHEGLPKKACEISFAGLKAIHEYLFQDIYEWAGKERTYTTGRNAVPFARPEFIEKEMNKLFAALRKENYLNGLNQQDFSARAAYYVNEINAAHPFIEGNGRVQRVWLRQLAEQAGYSLDLCIEDREAWNNASKVGFLALDHHPMAQLIEARLTPLRDLTVNQEQTNEALSKIYLNTPRSEAANNPALRNAVNMEVYIERKLRTQYRDDPAAVEHGLNIARNKIADMIARGINIESPKIIDAAEKQSKIEPKRNSHLERARR